MNKWILCSTFFISTVCFAGTTTTQSNLIQDGLFLGLGGDYNSISLTQNSWGQGISTIQTNTGTTTNGIAEGSGAPFKETTNTLSPEIQIGYFKNIIDTQNIVGIKFTYQYLGSTATNSNLYIPQLGHSTNNTGASSSLFGYVNADSVQATTKHEMTLLAYVGRSFGNKYFYLGAGPSLFNLKSKNYYSIGYADFEGATLDITGLVSYSSPSIWAVGGAAQLGMTYFITPTWFIDFAYTYTKSGSKTTDHEQAFSNSSSIGSVDYTTTGTLYTKDTLKVSNQSLMLSVNKVLTG